MDCSLPGSFVPGIFQAWLLEWVNISSSGEFSQPGDQTHVSESIALQVDCFTAEPLVKLLTVH